MAVRTRRIVPALLVLLVLFASQAGYLAGASESPGGHCAGGAAKEPPPPCRLPLWLACCDDQAAVPVGASPIRPSAALVLLLASALAPALAPGAEPSAARAELPPDTPGRLSTVLQL